MCCVSLTSTNCEDMTISLSSYDVYALNPRLRRNGIREHWIGLARDNICFEVGSYKDMFYALATKCSKVCFFK